jgi:hypothetical protein
LIEWVNENTNSNDVFALATGHEFSMSDPLQEWFPALTGRASLTTLQGMEWTLGVNFFPWLEQLAVFQKCPDMTCLNDWAFRNNADYDYLIVLIPPEDAEDDLPESLRSLGVSARASATHALVYESEHGMIFEYLK